MNDTTPTPKTLDQIEAPGELKQMVDPANPRQAAILDQFLSDLGIPDAPPAPAPEEQAEPAAPAAEAKGDGKLLGKFNSPEELAKAYQELERKLGQKAPEPAAPPAAPEAYTPERGIEVYGETVAAAIEAAEINPFEMAARLEAGEDVASYVDALVEKGKLPRPLVEAYLQGVKPPAAAAAEAPGSLNDNEEAVTALMQSVGGQAEFTRLAQWAAANLSPAEKADYQAAVDAGNVLAAQWALRAIQARAAGGTRSEPDFLGGGLAATEAADVYENRSEWQKARYATDDNGNEIYTRDEGYRQSVDAKHQRSKRAGKW